MTSEKENRRSFRVVESVLLKYDVIDEVDFDMGLHRWQLRSGGFSSVRSKVADLDARLEEILFRLGNESAACRDAIRLVNQKLEVVLETLPEFRQSKESLANVPVQECEVSADSIVFASDEALKLDTKLWLRFVLTSDNRFVETFGSVLKCTERDEPEGQPQRYRIVACFHGMPNAERETLIQHLFSMQSQTLRMRRIQADEGN